MYIILRQKKYDRLVIENAVASSLVDLHTRHTRNPDDATASCIIFSMDRALQLHALLSSYFENVTDAVPVHVLYRTSSRPHRTAYDEVFSEFTRHRVTAVAQESRESFKKQLMGILDSMHSSNVLFLVDDIVFVEKVDMTDFIKSDTRTIVPSLRMGANLKRAYTVRQDQELPPFVPQTIAGGDKLCWVWAEGVHDWSYPLSVDGHLFSTEEFGILANYTEFNSPNTLEANLQAWVKYFKHRYGVCYRKSKIMNIPANRVQSDIPNVHGTVHQDYLLEQWNRGMQMNYRSLYGFVNESAHQDVPIAFIERR